MNPGVALILLTKLDTGNFLPLAREVLGYSPASAADGVPIPLKELEHCVACMASFKDETANPHLTAACPHFNLFHAGFLIAADERDMVDILEFAAMPYVRTDTLSRGIEAAVISGSLIQWRDAVKLTCLTTSASTSRGVRSAFNTIYKIFLDNGMRALFDGFQITNLSDRTFLLEHH